MTISKPISHMGEIISADHLLAMPSARTFVGFADRAAQRLAGSRFNSYRIGETL